MLEKTKKFDIPGIFLMKRIEKDARIELFQAIYAEYKKRYPHIKFEFGYLNWDLNHPIDFIILGSSIDDTGTKFMLMEISLFGARRSIPGFHYMLTHNNEDKYFEDGYTNLMPVAYDRFEHLMTVQQGLSFDKKSPLYWKKPENFAKTLEIFEKFGMKFQPDGIE